MSTKGIFSRTGRLTVCYLTDGIGTTSEPGSDTARGFWEGMQTACAEHDCNLLAVLHAEKNGLGSVLHDLLDGDSANVLVSWIKRTDPEIETFFARFAHNAPVCLSIRHRDYPTVLIANRKGLEDLFRHLIEVHGYQRIAMIRGPESQHPAATERFHIYREMLHEYHLPDDPRFYSDPGDWSVEQGRLGVCTLLDQHGLLIGHDVDAIVCASDRIAMGAIAELQRRGFRVPGQVAVTGFNNLQEVQCQTPSLTSVSNPFQLQAIHAVKRALNTLGLKIPPADESLLDSVLAVGESCGCANPHLHIPYRQKSGLDFRTLSLNDAEDELQRELTAYLLLLKVAMPEVAQQCQALILAYRRALSHGEPEIFTEEIIPRLKTGHYAYMDLVHWQDVLSVFQHWVVATETDTARRTDAEYILDMARVAVSDHYARGQTAYQLEETRLNLLIRQLGEQLVSVGDLHGLTEQVRQTLPALGIRSCWLATYANEASSLLGQAPAQSMLRLAVEAGENYLLPPGGIFFASAELIPANWIRRAERAVLIACPLIYGNKEYGFIVFSQGPQDGDLYTNLASTIASGMQGVLYRQELELRAGQLEESLLELCATQEKLVESAKMAALGEMVTGLAHELNTPVGIGVTLASTIEHEVQSMLGRINSGSVARASITASLNMLVECSQTLTRNLDRASSLVDSFKLVSIDQTREARREFDFSSYLQDIVRSFSTRLQQAHHEVDIDCPSTLLLRSYPGAFAQTLSNLILNSIIHGFGDREGGHIDIKVEVQNEMMEIVYQDDGVGMNTDILARIYNPFFTTRRNQGSAGLGMHIAYNQITQVLGGTIECVSMPGQGTCFTLHLPLIPPENPLQTAIAT